MENNEPESDRSQEQSEKGGQMETKGEKEKQSELVIISPDGSITGAEEFSWGDDEDLKAFYLYESSGTRVDQQPPAHIKMMQQFELVDYEPAADPGNFRWLPKGHLVKRLLESYASGLVKDYGGMQVETPIMYDLNQPQLASYLKRFPARQYHLLSGDKKYFLRFAACFGQYMIMRDMGITFRHLPVKIYELTHYSFRRELSGELSGLRRLRGFTMPDMHTLCADMAQAREEFYQQYLLCKRWMNDLKLHHVLAIRVVDEFFQENRDFIMGIVRDFGRPVLFEIWKERLFYFILKLEFNVVDGQKKAATLSTAQIDVENAARFGIHYADENGQPQTPLILHVSISGSIDRNLYALLEQQARIKEGGGNADLPYWLSPVQLRLIPVSSSSLPRCLEIALHLKARVEIDDRKETLGHKIRDAEVKWIPFIGIIGEKELESGAISLRERGTPEQKILPLVELAQILGGYQGEKPYEPINWPLLISKQPRFH
jgi:threonyl-tRNA synthetase